MSDDPSGPRPEHDRISLDPDTERLDDALDRLLADPAVWVDAPVFLEDKVVEEVRSRAEANERARRRRPSRRRAYVFMTAAAAAVIVAVVVAATLVARGDGSRADFAADLRGTELAPAAHASVGITKNRGGFTVALDAHGLQSLPAGEFYQAWLKNDAGTLIPIGTFSSSDSHVTLWSGASPKDFPTLTVTIERPDGNQSSSGRRVLTGTVHPQ
jgi:hypothetical protein